VWFGQHLECKKCHLQRLYEALNATVFLVNAGTFEVDANELDSNPLDEEMRIYFFSGSSFFKSRLIEGWLSTQPTDHVRVDGDHRHRELRADGDMYSCCKPRSHQNYLEKVI
jgi:hypothetical protein